MKILSTGDVAERLGVSLYLVARFAKRLNLGQLLGRNRALSESDVPRLRDALIGAGHMKGSAESATDETMRPLSECESRGLILAEHEANVLKGLSAIRMFKADGRILTQTEHETRALIGLVILGKTEADARKCLADRWPMGPESVLSECRCRGLSLRVDDLTDYLRHKFARESFSDGTPLVAEGTAWPPFLVDGLLEWAVAEGRGMARSKHDDSSLTPLQSDGIPR